MQSVQVLGKTDQNEHFQFLERYNNRCNMDFMV